MPWRFILLGTLSGFQREYLQGSAQQREKKIIYILTKESRHSQKVYLGPTQTRDGKITSSDTDFTAISARSLRARLRTHR